jgi:CheY-like chemotaxis protein
MMMTTNSVRSGDAIHSSSALSSAAQKVVIVSGNPEILALAERVLEAGNYNVVFVEAIAHAYTQIKRVQPNLVILCLNMEDANGFQVLSMLKLDEETRHIPVLTYAAEDRPAEAAEDEEDVDDNESQFFTPPSAALMN